MLAWRKKEKKKRKTERLPYLAELEKGYGEPIFGIVSLLASGATANIDGICCPTLRSSSAAGRSLVSARKTARLISATSAFSTASTNLANAPMLWVPAESTQRVRKTSETTADAPVYNKLRLSFLLNLTYRQVDDFTVCLK